MKTIMTPRLDSSSYWVADLLTIGLVVFLGFGFVYFVDVSSAPYLEEVAISTSLSSLPGYALLSLIRSLIALTISYLFAIAYGTFAARNERAGRILIPLLDVLQSLPVLTFLPGVLLALTALFESSRWGLELACILMLFTGQVWNLIFAYYESQRTMLAELREFSHVARLTILQKFLVLDLPNGVRPLVYNGMMSMAGGWFFLTLCEAFVLGDKSFRLPGLGSYLHVSFERGEISSFVAGLFVLLVIIVGVDFLLWKPLIAWAAQFRESTDENEPEPKSWFLELLKRTRVQNALLEFTEALVRRFRKETPNPADAAASQIALAPGSDLYTNGVQATASANSAASADATAALQGRSGALHTPSRTASPGAPHTHAASGHTPSGFQFERFAKIIRPRDWGTSTKVPAFLRNFAWAQWLVSFAVGGLVFYLLPRLPAIGQAMGTVKSEDWLELSHALFMTAAKVGAVLVFATIWTVPFGIWVGQNARVAAIVQPIIQNLAAFPAPVLFPLIALTVSNAGIPPGVLATLLMTIGNQWYMLFNVISGASRLSPELKVVTRVYRLDLMQRYAKFYIPGIMPSLATGWITAAGGAWNASIVAEIVAFPGGEVRAQGIGAEITLATQQGNYPRLVAAVICITLALVFLNRTVWRTLNQYIEKLKA